MWSSISSSYIRSRAAIALICLPAVVTAAPAELPGKALAHTSSGSASRTQHAAATRAAPLTAPTATSTALSLTPQDAAATSIQAGTPVTVSVVVTASGAALTSGQVRLCDASVTLCSEIHQLGSAQLTGKGSASFTLRPAIGSHVYRALFVATNTHSTSVSAPLSLTIDGQYRSTTAFAEGSASGQHTFDATVNGLGKTVAPSGTVVFEDHTNSDYVLASASLVAGESSLGIASGQDYTVGDYPQSIIAGDFNADGALDVAVAEYGTGKVSVLLGKGDGTFAAAVSYPAGNQPQSVATADFNGDGALDLAVANAADDTVSILLGNGDGTFANARNYPTGSGPISIASGDFNQDGILDLAVDNLNVSTVSILLGNADGTFAAKTDYATGTYSQYVSTADFNNDGHLDLVTANYAEDTVSILLGNGAGTFSSRTDIASGTEPVQVSVADFNSDGNADLAVADSGSGDISILLGKGDGTFQAKSAYPLGAACYFAGVGDFNGDGLVDLMGLVDTTKVIRMLLGKGDGTFTAQSSAATQDSLSEVVGDFDGDGLDDVLVTNYYYESISPYSTKLTYSASASATAVALTGAGSHAVVARYVGNSAFLPSVSDPLSIAGNPSATTLSVAVNPATTTFGTPQVLQATLTPSASQGHSSDGQTVTFMSGTTILETAPLSSGIATLTTTSMPIGSDGLSAVFSGDAYFAKSSATATSVVTAATDFLFTTSGSTTETVANGSRTTFDFTLDYNGSFHSYPSAVTFEVNGLPEDATYTMTPNTVSQTGGPQTITLTVQTSSGTVRNIHLGDAATILASILFLLPLSNTRRFVTPRWMLHGVLLTAGWFAVVSLSGCDGSKQTSAKDYALTVVAKSGSMQHAVQVTLGVL